MTTHRRIARHAARRAPTTATIVAALVLVSAHPVAAQAPGTSNGNAATYPSGLLGSGGCAQGYFAQPSGSATCNGSTTTAGANASTASTNAIRTASAQSGTNMSGGSGNPYADASSIQFGQVTVSGTGGSPTSLVYHFDANTETTVTGGTQTGTGASWELFLSSTQQGTETDGYVLGSQGWNDATTQVLFGSNGRVTASGTGYDFTAPFNATDGTVTFDFTTTTSAASYNEADASSWAFIIGMLSSIDAVNGQGQTVGSVTFGADGNGTLVLGGTGTTTPEPDTLALLATGLLGLAPIVRRKR